MFLKDPQVIPQCSQAGDPGRPSAAGPHLTPLCMLVLGLTHQTARAFSEPRCTNNDLFNNVNHIVLLTLIKSSRGFSRLLESMQAPHLGLRDARQYELAHLRREKGKVLVAQSCLTLCHPMGCSPFHTVYGVFKARILKWLAIPFSRGRSTSWNQDCREKYQ